MKPELRKNERYHQKRTARRYDIVTSLLLKSL